MALSKESEQFLSNLRVYLMTSGKKEEEILRVIEKVEHQLLEAEQEGKSIQSIIGNSPEVYMKAIGKEMKTDMKGTVFVCLYHSDRDYLIEKFHFSKPRNSIRALSVKKGLEMIYKYLK